MLVLACILFTTGVATFIIALSNQNSPTSSPSPLPQIAASQVNSQSDTLILTPIGPIEDIVVGKNIIFSLVSVPKDWEIKAKLQIYQKEVRGEPYKNNFIEVAYVGKISKDETLGWKELDVTQKVAKELTRNRKSIIFRLEPNNEGGNKNTENLAIFDGVAQLVVSKI